MLWPGQYARSDAHSRLPLASSLLQLVLTFSSLTWPDLPFSFSSSSFSSSSSSRPSTPHLTLEDLDAMDEDADGGASGGVNKDAPPLRFARAKSVRSRRQKSVRLHGISTAPDWMKTIPPACKHAAAAASKQKAARSSSSSATDVREQHPHRSSATLQVPGAGLRAMVVGDSFPYTRIN